MRGPCCNATITWQILLSIPRGEGGRSKKDLRWTCHAFQPRNLWRLVFAVSLKFLISVDFLSNVPSYNRRQKVWNFCTGPWGHASRRHCWGFVWPEKTLIASSWGKLPLLVWNQDIQQQLLKRPHPTKNTHSSEWSMMAASRVPVPSLRRWGICMECVLTVRRFTTDLWPEATVLAESWGSYSCLSIITGSA